MQILVLCFVFGAQKKIPQKLAFHWTVQEQPFHQQSGETQSPTPCLTIGRFWGRSNGQLLQRTVKTLQSWLNTMGHKTKHECEKGTDGEGRDERLAVRIARRHYIHV